AVLGHRRRPAAEAAPLARHRGTRPARGVHFPRAARLPGQSASGHSRPAPAPLRRSSARGQLDGAARARPTPARARLLRAAEGACLHRGARPLSRHPMKSKNTAGLALVRLCCRVLDDKKAGELTVLDVSAESSITDYLVLATATSEPHLRALRV